MIRSTVDAKPEFEGLNISASALMAEARLREAKGQPFDAAVAWIKAGKEFGELADRLVKARHIREGAEDFLNAAYCFLRAGDYRPASEVLQRFDGSPLDEARRHAHVLSELEEMKKWCSRREGDMDKARQELRRQMKHPLAADKLEDSWLRAVLAKMPGVVDFHWLAGKKASLSRSYARAIEHYRWCVDLRPEDVGFWIFLVNILVVAKEYDTAVEWAENGLAFHSRAPEMLFFAASSRMRWVVDGQGPKMQLPRALKELEASLNLGFSSESNTVGVICTLCHCLRRMGDPHEANRRLNDAIRRYPLLAADLAWRMLKAKGVQAEWRIVAEVPQMILPTAA